MAGPLASLKVVEFSGLGPAPLAGQLLADQLMRRNADIDVRPYLPERR